MRLSAPGDLSAPQANGPRDSPVRPPVLRMGSRAHPARPKRGAASSSPGRQLRGGPRARGGGSFFLEAGVVGQGTDVGHPGFQTGTPPRPWSGCVGPQARGLGSRAGLGVRVRWAWRGGRRADTSRPCAACARAYRVPVSAAGSAGGRSSGWGQAAAHTCPLTAGLCPPQL